MLTGVLSMTNGRATVSFFKYNFLKIIYYFVLPRLSLKFLQIFGLDVERDIKQIRQMIGCPQQDILYDELTVEEHLRFFCELKR